MDYGVLIAMAYSTVFLGLGYMTLRYAMLHRRAQKIIYRHDRVGE